ncbi:MAG: hypothetical protein PHO41_06320 [Eubacteriales bacterium]|nr:hypothetical protein [Eubacteriales bacterium]
MGDLFSSVTLLFLLGLIAGLVGFTFLYKKWDIPGYFKAAFKLNSRVKAFLFVFVFGVVLSFCLALIMDVLRLSEQAMQVMEGISVGFMCSMLPTLLGTKVSSSKSNTSSVQKRGQSSSSGGRRSKG